MDYENGDHGGLRFELALHISYFGMVWDFSRKLPYLYALVSPASCSTSLR